MRTRAAAVLLALAALAALVALAFPALAHSTNYQGTGCATNGFWEACYEHKHNGPYQQVYYHTDHSYWLIHKHDSHCHPLAGGGWTCTYLP